MSFDSVRRGAFKAILFNNGRLRNKLRQFEIVVSRLLIILRPENKLVAVVNPK